MTSRPSRFDPLPAWRTMNPSGQDRILVEAMTKTRRLLLASAMLWATLTITSATASAAENNKQTYEKPGYAVDGRTSASVLAAKRSHEVAEEDALGLAIFSGLFVIAVIGFLSHQWFDRK